MQFLREKGGRPIMAIFRGGGSWMLSTRHCRFTGWISQRLESSSEKHYHCFGVAPGRTFLLSLSKNYWFRHCAVGLYGSVKLILASLLSKILKCPVRLPAVSSACRSTTGKCFAHLQPSRAVHLLPCTCPPPLPLHPPFPLVPWPHASKPSSNSFHLSLISGCRELATNQLVTQMQTYKNRKAHAQPWPVVLASTLPFTDIKQKQLYRGEGCYTFQDIRTFSHFYWALEAESSSPSFRWVYFFYRLEGGGGIKTEKEERDYDLCGRISNNR